MHMKKPAAESLLLPYWVCRSLQGFIAKTPFLLSENFRWMSFSYILPTTGAFSFTSSISSPPARLHGPLAEAAAQRGRLRDILKRLKRADDKDTLAVIKARRRITYLTSRSLKTIYHFYLVLIIVLIVEYLCLTRKLVYKAKFH